MFRTVFDEAARRLAIEISNGAAFKVFLVLPEHLSYVQFRRLDQRKLGAILRLTDSAVSRALKKLHTLGVVDRRGTGPVTEWKLTPEFGWRGSVESYHAERRARALLGTPANSGAMPAVVAEDILQKRDDPAPLAPQRRIRLLAPVRS